MPRGRSITSTSKPSEEGLESFTRLKEIKDITCKEETRYLAYTTDTSGDITLYARCKDGREWTSITTDVYEAGITAPEEEPRRKGKMKFTPHP